MLAEAGSPRLKLLLVLSAPLLRGVRVEFHVVLRLEHGGGETSVQRKSVVGQLIKRIEAVMVRLDRLG